MFLMKIAAFERTKFTAKRTLGGAALGAGAGAAINALRGEDWRSGALAGAGIGGALGTARGAYAAQRLHNIGKGVKAEGNHGDKSNMSAAQRFSEESYRRIGENIGKGLRLGEISPREVWSEYRSKSKEHQADLERLRGVGRSQK